MVLDHSGVQVPADKTAAVTAWYEAALKPLGYSKQIVMADGQVASFGDVPNKADWWVIGVPDSPNLPTHHAFRAKDRATVDAFYKAAIDAGGESNGEPGLRAHYHANYYGAFVKDPAGNNIEAVCHDPE